MTAHKERGLLAIARKLARALDGLDEIVQAADGRHESTFVVSGVHARSLTLDRSGDPAPMVDIGIDQGVYRVVVALPHDASDEVRVLHSGSMVRATVVRPSECWVRTIRLPAGVDPDSLQWKVEENTLTITAAKNPPA